MGSVNAPKILTAIAAAGLVAVPVVDARTPPPQKKGATYSGVTSQGANACHTGSDVEAPCDVTAKVTSSGKRVRLLVKFTADCGDGNVYQSSTAFDSLKITSGKFSASATYVETLSDGTKVDNAVATHGKFKRKNKKYSLVGDYKVSSDVTFPDASTAKCESGKVTFTAKAK
jgi:hypothetical protein